MPTLLLGLVSCIPGPVTFTDPELDDSAVTGTDDSGGSTDDSDEPGDDTGEPTDDSGGGDDSGDDTGPVDFDCDNLPNWNDGDRNMSEARGYHGVVMDDDGHLIGWDGRNALIKSSYGGDRDVWIPGQNSVEQLARHPDGTIFMARASGGELYEITPDGTMTRIAANLNGIYGVTLGPDGNLYVGKGDVVRVNRQTGEVTQLVAQPQNWRWTAHSLAFSLDSTKLYIGTIGSGELLVADLDEDLNVVGDVRTFARTSGGWMDAIGVDICGNLYVPDYYSSSLYRISPDGQTVEDFVTQSRTAYGHGLTWGSGLGGWRADALYMPQPYNGNTIREVIIGVPNGDSVRTWNGEPVEY
ncbi:MAG: SMP-30/gluconolactonase/LRE family protein [Alphaproteobacteria bacterium]|nr:SMP-30/gluconolactonase/LRE family protein [Alphaproteobacteria bacterium]